MEKVQCKECEEMGHFARDCPNKKCRNCEKPGHHSRDCPVPPPTCLHMVSLAPFRIFCFSHFDALCSTADLRNPAIRKTWNAGIVSRWVILCVIVLNLALILVVCAIIASLLVPSPNTSSPIMLSQSSQDSLVTPCLDPFPRCARAEF